MVLFQEPLDELLHLSSLLWRHLVDLQLLHKCILTSFATMISALRSLTLQLLPKRTQTVSRPHHGGIDGKHLLFMHRQGA